MTEKARAAMPRSALVLTEREWELLGDIASFYRGACDDDEEETAALALRLIEASE